MFQIGKCTNPQSVNSFIILLVLQHLIPARYLTDEESCLETDQESYIRTDDEEGGNTEWEDAMRRWVNR